MAYQKLLSEEDLDEDFLAQGSRNILQSEFGYSAGNAALRY